MSREVPQFVAEILSDRDAKNTSLPATAYGERTVTVIAEPKTVPDFFSNSDQDESESKPSTSITVLSDAKDRKYVEEHFKFILEDFEKYEKIAQEWKREIKLKPHVIEYLDKLIAQLNLGMKIISQAIDPFDGNKLIPNRIALQQCIKLIQLWRVAKKEDILAYFINIEENKRRRRLITARTKVHEKMSPCLLAFPQNDERDKDIQNLYRTKLLKGTDFIECKNNQEHETKVTEVDIAESEIRDFMISLYTQKILNLAFIRISRSSRGFVNEAIRAVLTQCSGYIIKRVSLCLDSFHAALYLTKAKAYRTRLPGKADEMMGWKSNQGIQQFFHNPEAVRQETKSNQEGVQTLIAATLVTGEIKNIPTLDPTQKPERISKIAGPNPSYGIFYETLRYQGTTIVVEQEAYLEVVRIDVKKKEDEAEAEDTTPKFTS
jgi:hypothetical protein